mmetsp:Transcript_87419/g.178234  ORF Transcript_87419/g.178234 Transcript_87419/m.178234 type:complete len:223 (+) Transcript_87419:625-1293(+)
MTPLSAFRSTAREGTDASPASPNCACTSCNKSSPSTACRSHPLAVMMVRAASMISRSKASGKSRQWPSCWTYGPEARKARNSAGEAATSYSNVSMANLGRGSSTKLSPPRCCCPKAEGASNSLTRWASKFAGVRTSCPRHWAKIVHVAESDAAPSAPCEAGGAFPSGAAAPLPSAAPSPDACRASTAPKKRELVVSRNSTLKVAVSVHKAAQPVSPSVELCS